MTGAARRGLGLVVALGLAWLVGYPLLITLLEALGYPQGWTLDHFSEFAHRPDEWQALWRSLWISAASVALAAAVGVPLAFIFERTEFPGRQLLGALVALPVALPPLVGVIAFLFLYGESGFFTRGVATLFGLESSPWRLHGPGAILLVHAYSMYVYFYLFTRAGLARLDASLLEAAASLGAGRLRTLWKVTLPILGPALAGAALLTFMTSLASFSAPYLFGGGFRVMTTQIVASKLNGEVAMAQVETVTLAGLALIGLLGLGLVDRGRAAVVGGVRGIAPVRRRLGSWPARLGAAALGWGLALFLLLPHLTLLLISFVPPGTWTTEAVPPVLDGGNYTAVLGGALPIWLAAAAAAVAVVLGLASRWAARSGATTARAVLASPWLKGALLAALLAGGAYLLQAAGYALAPALRPVSNSLWMAAVATAGAVALGLAAARLAVRLGGRFGGLLEILLAVPWAVPGTVFAISLASAFSVHDPAVGRFVLVGTPWILPLAYLVRSLPVTGRSALAGLRQFDPTLEEAAASLGAGRWRTLYRVTLPLLRPAILAGASLAFITALGDFVTSVVLYTFDTRPISIEILSSLRLQETGVAAVYGVLLMVVSGVAFLVWGREQKV